MDKKDMKRAAALSYDAGEDEAPVIVALGQGKVAERIIEAGEEHDVPIVPDKSLAQMLTQLSVGDNIPPELYSIVAEVLVFVSSLDEKYENRFNI